MTIRVKCPGDNECISCFPPRLEGPGRHSVWSLSPARPLTPHPPSAPLAVLPREGTSFLLGGQEGRKSLGWENFPPAPPSPAPRWKTRGHAWAQTTGSPSPQLPTRQPCPSSHSLPTPPYKPLLSGNLGRGASTCSLSTLSRCQVAK